jgi:deoxyribodipyrimidine photolyase-related protein
MSRNDRPLGRTPATGDTHHIERLMLLPNFGLLAGVHPRAVTDWFLSAYVDAYDCVMQPNVMGIGLNADGALVASSPTARASCGRVSRRPDPISSARA